MRHITRAERGWLAGFLDGDGYVTSQWSNNGRTIRFLVGVSASHPKDIHKAADIMGRIVGHRVGVMRYQPAGRGYWMFRATVSAQADILAVLTAVLPDLCGKRAQAVLLRRHLEWRSASWTPRKHGGVGQPIETPAIVLQKDREVRDRLSSLKQSFRVCTDYMEPSLNG